MKNDRQPARFVCVQAEGEGAREGWGLGVKDEGQQQAKKRVRGFKRIP